MENNSFPIRTLLNIMKTGKWRPGIYCPNIVIAFDFRSDVALMKVLHYFFILIVTRRPQSCQCWNTWAWDTWNIVLRYRPYCKDHRINVLRANCKILSWNWLWWAFSPILNFFHTVKTFFPVNCFIKIPYTSHLQFDHVLFDLPY